MKGLQLDLMNLPGIKSISYEEKVSAQKAKSAYGIHCPTKLGMVLKVLGNVVEDVCQV